MPYTTGQLYSGFFLKKQAHIDEIPATVYLFEHKRLGCPLVAIKNDDPNKTFTAAFNTIPTDSTGVAHILEHSVLMGSKKYPVKDVFGEINKGGLTTFLNAMTGSDLTYYPFATRNLKEYFNIMDVYCDVVFNPLLSRSTFEQEGWHYHQESEETPLQYQGVVFNEMKGAFSDPIRHIFHNVYSNLMPESTYSHESGGDPRNIPDLDHKGFCDFHAAHYHPSNSMLFVYGDAPLEDELEFLENRFLSSFESPGKRVEAVSGEKPASPVFVEESYAVDAQDTQGKTFLAVGTEVSTVTNREENTAFQIIANILFNSDGSPLKNSIVSSGLCKDFGGLYLCTSSFRTLMLTYLVGSEPEHRDEFLTLFRRSLKEMVERGLDQDLVISELNKFEFSYREEASKAQRGLDLIGKAMTALKYGSDPFDYLTGESLLSSIRKKALAGGYFEDLINRFLLDNPATVVVTLKPDPLKMTKDQAAEQEQLASFERSLKAEDKKQIIDRTRELMELQMQPNSAETLELLPRLGLEDLEKKSDYHAVSPTTMFDQEVLVSELPTNHISYFDAGFDARCLRPEELVFLDLFGTIVTEIGTEKLNYQQFAKAVATSTGGFSHSLSTYSHRGKTVPTRPICWFHLKWLPSSMDQALDLLSEVFSSVSFADRARIAEIVAREYAWAEHSVQSEGYSLPTTRGFAHLSDAGRYNEFLTGITSYQALKDLATQYQTREEGFLTMLKEISEKLFRRGNLILSLTADGDEVDTFSTSGEKIVQSLGQTDPEYFPLTHPAMDEHEAFITSAEVVFAVQAGNIFPEGRGYNGHFEVLKTYLSRDYLWNSVRQMGGAYGCFIQFGQLSGNLAFVSYRDPQVKKTYEAYAQVEKVIAELDLSGKVLEQLIIGTYGTFTPLQSVAAKGATARNEFLNGIDLAFKERRLQEIISTRLTDLKSFAGNFHEMQPTSIRKIIGNRSKIEADRALFTSLTTL